MVYETGNRTVDDAVRRVLDGERQPVGPVEALAVEDPPDGVIDRSIACLVNHGSLRG